MIRELCKWGEWRGREREGERDREINRDRDREMRMMDGGGAERRGGRGVPTKTATRNDCRFGNRPPLAPQNTS